LHPRDSTQITAPTFGPVTLPTRNHGRIEPTGLERWAGRLGERGTRMLNVTVALVGIVATAPLMLFLAVLVKLTSPGPVLFTQQRVGVDQRSGPDRRRNGRAAGAGRRHRDRGGRIFTIYKFRTMTVSQQKDPDQVWARVDDPRITPVGAVLRKYRLDELPQLLNVLKGDMNIVGPRPEQPEIFEQLERKVNGYRLRQRVLPGITGWAQVNLHYDQCLEDVRRKVVLDLEYIERRSPAEDLRIMARTLPVMIGKKGGI
jgi:lipopolysaccharide/colanic/teichoic acid biosynthesis glycosyltransferase